MGVPFPSRPLIRAGKTNVKLMRDRLEVGWVVGNCHP